MSAINSINVNLAKLVLYGKVMGDKTRLRILAELLDKVATQYRQPGDCNRTPQALFHFGLYAGSYQARLINRTRF